MLAVKIQLAKKAPVSAFSFQHLSSFSSHGWPELSNVPAVPSCGDVTLISGQSSNVPYVHVHVQYLCVSKCCWTHKVRKALGRLGSKTLKNGRSKVEYKVQMSGIMCEWIGVTLSSYFNTPVSLVPTVTKILLNSIVVLYVLVHFV